MVRPEGKKEAVASYNKYGATASFFIIQLKKPSQRIP